ncbi:hypothetical protein ACFXOH_23015 [Bacillus subtilis]
MAERVGLLDVRAALMSVVLNLALAAALVDMRKGHRVLVVTENRDAVAHLLHAARQFLRTGERLNVTNGGQQITCPSGGWIRFRYYSGVTRGSVRGFTLDRVHVDHFKLWDELEPALNSAAAGPAITHH